MTSPDHLLRRQRREQGSSAIQLLVLLAIAASVCAPLAVVGSAVNDAITFQSSSRVPTSTPRVSSRSLAVVSGLASDLRRYARVYGAFQRRFNGARPEETLVHGKFAKKTKGLAPYWDTEPTAPGLDPVGEYFDLSPFRTAEGQVRIFAHYLDYGRIASLTGRFGAPSGHTHAEMTSSYRTLLMFPNDESAPFMLKLPGDWLAPHKGLSPAQVRLSVLRSEHFRDSDFLIPEPAGLVVHDGDSTLAAALSRPLPAPSSGLQRADALITIQTLFRSAESGFDKSEIGRRLIAHSGSIEQWLSSEFAPALGDVLYESIFRDFTHLELHTQNIDALVGEDGALRHNFVKDQLDMMYDPILEAATTGKLPADVHVLRNEASKHLGEPDAKYSLDEYLSEFLAQTLRLQMDMAQPMWEQVVKRAAMDFGDEGVKKTRGLSELRDLRIRTQLEEKFIPDPTARAFFDRDDVIVAQGPHNFSFRDESGVDSTLVYGRVGEVPVALRRDGNGIIAYMIAYPN